MLPLTCALVYIGDASTLSILQLIRIIVENTAGSDMGSPFIDDPKRHRIMENIIEFPQNIQIPTQLPDKDIADILIDSYFTNVSHAHIACLLRAAADICLDLRPDRNPGPRIIPQVSRRLLQRSSLRQQLLSMPLVFGFGTWPAPSSSRPW